MIISKVIGEVVATRKHPSHEGIKLLTVREIDRQGLEHGPAYIAVDVLDAGIGDTVLLTMDGWAAMTAIKRSKSPIDAAVIAIIDFIDWDQQVQGNHPESLDSLLLT